MICKYKCIYNDLFDEYVFIMEFEWDAAKDRLNRAKHGISFAEAIEIFEAAVLMWQDSRRDYGEPRYISVGILGDAVVVLLVVHTPRGRKTRIISARKANARERKLYHAYLEKETRRDRGSS